jgi:tRNA-2-methylthio-N6-dimethylallyladenosine synthase
MENQVPAEVVTHRYDQLTELQESISWQSNRDLIGTEVEVLISQSVGKKDVANGRLSGRARDGRLVHVNVTGLDPGFEQLAQESAQAHTSQDRPRIGPGDLVGAMVTYAAPHHLVADAGVRWHRPWRGRTGAAHAPSPTPLLTIGRAGELR